MKNNDIEFKMNISTIHIMHIVFIFLQNILCIMSSVCNNSKYWCHELGAGLIHPDLSFVQLNISEYKECLMQCNENTTCQAFEYESDLKSCRFASNLSGNVQLLNTSSTELYWEKTANKSCMQEIYEGN